MSSPDHSRRRRGAPPGAPLPASGDPPMPATPHVEQHFTATAAVRDVVIGMSDGLTVPFALAAGLSGAVASSRIVVTAGAAGIAPGTVRGGGGGDLAARAGAGRHRPGGRRR